MNKIMALILAKKYSKRLPEKNKRKLLGKPLFIYAIEEAKKSKYITEILISTDDEEIKKIALKQNINVIDRPHELAKDNVSSQTVIDDVMEKLQPNIPDITVLLQPTSPLRTTKWIDKCIELLIKQDYDGVITVVDCFKKSFHENGAVYAFKGTEIWNKKQILLVMPKEESIDIDTIYDFKLAEIIKKSSKERKELYVR